MSDWIHPELKSISSPAIVEYIGPYGAGKTTRLNRDKRELQNHHAQVVDREDFKGFIAGYTKVQKAFLLFFNFPLYLPAFVLLFFQSRGAIISDRRRRCHLVAMKSLYFRRFMSNKEPIFLSDEGLLHSCCQLFTGATRTPSLWLLRLLYWQLNPVFVRIEPGEVQLVKNVRKRESARALGVRPVLESPNRRKFVDLMRSSDDCHIQLLVRESIGFYQRVTPVVSKAWPTLTAHPFDGWTN